jgi:hypothetical protein
MARWDPDDHTQKVGLAEQFVLNPRLAEGRFVVTDEIKRRMSRYRLTEMYEDMTRNTVVRVERDVHEHRLLDETETVGFTRIVPWAVTIPIPVERTIWQRLLRRPREWRWRQIHGQVRVYGEVDVNITDGRTFPDAPHYPGELGKPIVYQTVDMTGTRYVGARSEATDHAHVADDGDDFAHLAYDHDPEENPDA